MNEIISLYLLFSFLQHLHLPPKPLPTFRVIVGELLEGERYLSSRPPTIDNRAQILQHLA